MTKASASSRPMAVERKYSCTSVPFPVGSTARREVNSLPTNSWSMVRAVPKRELLPLSGNGRYRPAPRAAASSLQYSPFVFCSLSLLRSLPAGYLLLFLRFTLSQVSLPSSLTHSTRLLRYGTNGELRKVRCTCLLFSVVGLAPWLDSDCFATSQRRHLFRPHFGSLSCSTAEHSAGCFRLLAQECFTPC